jgi:hypothetical protein
MSLENSLDALCREFEIDNVVAPDPIQQVTSAAPNPMSFLDEEALGSDTLVQTVPTIEDDDNPSVADLKKKAEDGHKEIVKLEEEVKLNTMTQRYDLEDRAYMKTQLKSLISDNRAVMDCIESQLKIGTNPHLFEVYASMSKTVADNIMRLAKIDQMVTDYKIVEDKGTGNIKHDVVAEQAAQAAANGQGGGNTYIQNNLCFSSDELLKIVKKAIPPREKTKIEDLPKFDLS